MLLIFPEEMDLISSYSHRSILELAWCPPRSASVIGIHLYVGILLCPSGYPDLACIGIRRAHQEIETGERDAPIVVPHPPLINPIVYEYPSDYAPIVPQP